MLAPEFKETVLGKAQVMAVFSISKVGNIAGCKVIQGEVRRNGKIRAMRGEKQLHDGEISSLKIMKDDVREVRQGYECGISLKNFNDFNPGDILECYIVEKAS